MAVYLIVVEGPRTGDRFKVKTGTYLGRAKSDINLRDPKVSSKHAYILEDGPDTFLVDNESTNGIKVDGKKTPRLLLTSGLKLTVGGTVIEVLIENAPDKESHLEEWRKSLLRTVSRVSGFNPTEIANIKAFEKPVELRIHDGIIEHTRIFAYGPREVDSYSLDLDFDPPDNPAYLFTLSPTTDQGVRFETPHPDFVQLNGGQKPSDMLKDGDVITIKNVELKVSIR